jgi:hypothetical protein
MREGAREGCLDGGNEGSGVGGCVGARVVGALVGAKVVGGLVGNGVGSRLGEGDGEYVGTGDGWLEGSGVGDGVGGHDGPLEQLSVSVRLAHTAPPYFASETMARARCFVPTPQAAEQVPQDCHAVRAQSVGQAVDEQFRLSENTVGHSKPSPSCSRVTIRERTDLPPPQLTVHVVHALHGVTVQSTGQTNVLHAWSVLVCGQPSPVPTCGTVTRRVRTITPPSQVCEHVVQDDQLATLQFTGVTVGHQVGTGEGKLVGRGVGNRVGGTDGVAVDGAGVGVRVVGAGVGVDVGAGVGVRVVGVGVGVEVGAGVGRANECSTTLVAASK